MDCRMPSLAALVLTLGSGCVTTPMSQTAGGSEEQPPGAVVKRRRRRRKAPRCRAPSWRSAIKEREADKPGAEPAEQMKSMTKPVYLSRSLQIDPKYRDAIQGLARVYTHMDDFEHAWRSIKKPWTKIPRTTACGLTWACA